MLTACNNSLSRGPSSRIVRVVGRCGDLFPFIRCLKNQRAAPNLSTNKKSRVMKANNNNTKSVNEVKVSKVEARNSVLAALSNEVTLSKFCKVINDRNIVPAEVYNKLLSAYNLSEDFEISFKWFVENCPKNAEGSFCKWTKVNEKTVFQSDNASENRVTEKGVVYTLVPYNVRKANYSVFLQMFGDVVAEVVRKKREALKLQKAAEKAEREKAAAERNAEKARKAAEKSESNKEKVKRLLSSFSEEEISEILAAASKAA